MSTVFDPDSVPYGAPFDDEHFVDAEHPEPFNAHAFAGYIPFKIISGFSNMVVTLGRDGRSIATTNFVKGNRAQQWYYVEHGVFRSAINGVYLGIPRAIIHEVVQGVNSRFVWEIPADNRNPKLYHLTINQGRLRLTNTAGDSLTEGKPLNVTTPFNSAARVQSWKFEVA